MRKLFYFATMAFMLSACDKDEATPDSPSTPVPTSGVEIKLSTNLFGFEDVNENITRSVVADRTSMAVYIDNAADDTEIYGKLSFKEDSLGNLVSNNVKKAYYPENGNVDIYAIYPNIAELGSDGSTLVNTVVQHIVADPVKANEKADLLMAVKSDVAKTEDKVEIEFQHLLSNLVIAIEQGKGSPDVDGAEISIIDMQLTAVIDFGKRPDENGIKSAAERGKMISAKPNSAGSINVKTHVKTSSSTVDDYGQAIVVPQTIKGGTPFIKIKLRNGDIRYASFDSDYTFESGKRYILTVTVDQNIKISAEVEDWEVALVTDHEFNV